jgi:transitional endoplasmic reticulum ATPase
VLRLGCADVFQRFLGESERVLRTVFRRAAEAAPCIVIIDEIDVIAPNRALASASTTGMYTTACFIRALICF